MQPYNKLSSLLEQIKQGVRKRIKIKDLAFQHQISDIHLQRLFKFMFGIPLASYIRSRRLALSIESLLNTNLRIIDIASEYDFEHEQTYIRAFKREYGISPSEYRKSGGINITKAAGYSQYLTSVQVENLINIPEGYKGDCFHTSLCARFRYVGEHHYRDITWYRAKQMYEAINYFTDNINGSYSSLRHDLFFERIDISENNGTYCQMEWFTPKKNFKMLFFVHYLFMKMI